MNYRNPLDSIIWALAHVRFELPRLVDWWPKNLRPEEINIHCWGQIWSDTTCGFGGIGGQAMTTADTVVLISEPGPAVVYIAGRFAYAIEKPNEKFRHDVQRQCVRPQREASVYERTEN